VDASRLPTSAELSKFCEERRKDITEWLITGGEDYALILSVSEGKSERIARKIERSLSIPANVVGNFTGARSRHIIIEGRKKVLSSLGWDHFVMR